jgi:hypothetical protein
MSELLNDNDARGGEESAKGLVEGDPWVGVLEGGSEVEMEDSRRALSLRLSDAALIASIETVNRDGSSSSNALPALASSRDEPVGVNPEPDSSESMSNEKSPARE